MSLVLDASMSLAWIFARADPEENALADRLLDAITEQPALVPVLWHTEIANALLVAERRDVVREAQVIDYLQRLARLPITTDAVSVASRQEAVMALGREHRLTAYDATYLELTLRTGSTLASCDSKLLAAARQAGAALYGLA
ncbi:type II toxin-antitoxin system VapC family toxin [Thiorhodococcus mannitoliphagus]|uniref:Type II toxin-antitoxin system VapC family toxin n=1 Tax=Thiorhodococcus mannitoliphagus TaxID=329406 RepID=A0A6P1DT54_9GAMM|nr:type II toxin-antitoxin system VapC family toxin [Thiorhodococcus mannitoliphagus]NEX19202.1 type II toxin-antitoxin system VapC family toxin [Thiorhodococcus mannitoliphagus]